MTDIDTIMDLLDWNRSEEEQQRGRQLARKIDRLDAFLQPTGEIYDKNVWDNCAKIVSERSDRELTPYLIPLLEWVRDLNWPGAICILDRMKRYADKAALETAFHSCMKQARAENDLVWMENLLEIRQT